MSQAQLHPANNPKQTDFDFRHHSLTVDTNVYLTMPAATMPAPAKKQDDVAKTHKLALKGMSSASVDTEERTANASNRLLEARDGICGHRNDTI